MLNQCSKCLTMKHNLICKRCAKEQKELPCGVSQWKNQGIKFGYWNYFINEVLADAKDESKLK